MPYDPNATLAAGSNPFAQRQASDPLVQSLMSGDVNAAMPEAYQDPNRGVGASLKNMISSLLSLPRRAIENSQYSLDSGTYDPGPTLEAATLPMGTGAIAGVPVKAGEAVLGAGPIRAYHGSPHDFDAFSMDKIGTGEGAQTYGHGLYFAENPQTAQAYRDQLSGKPVNLPADVDSPHFQPAMREAIANNAVQVAGKDIELAKKNLTDQINRYPAGSNARKDYEAALDMLDENPHKFAGRMYEVSIKADPEHFLDWDKPLTQQHPTVQSAAKQAMGPNWDQFKYAKAGDAVKQGFLAPGADTTASRLREAGIPGIKYLDQGSRAAGDGSRNYVVFNHDLIDILRKYGMVGAIPAAGGGFGVLAQQGQPKT